MIIHEVAVPSIGIIATVTPHSTKNGTIEVELIDQAYHTHTLYRKDNSEVY